MLLAVPPPPRGARTVLDEHRRLLAVTERLVREFHPGHSAGSVIRTVMACRDELARTGERSAPDTAVEAMARRRLTTAG